MSCFNQESTNKMPSLRPYRHFEEVTTPRFSLQDIFDKLGVNYFLPIEAFIYIYLNESSEYKDI